MNTWQSGIYITGFIIHVRLFGVSVTDREVNCDGVGAEVQF